MSRIQPPAKKSGIEAALAWIFGVCRIRDHDPTPALDEQDRLYIKCRRCGEEIA